MPSFPILRCTVCDCAVQMQMDAQAATMLMTSSGGSMNCKLLVSSELDSERFAAYCRGQGSFYGTKPENPYALPRQFDTHFNFSGVYTGMCCFCALQKGYHWQSFVSVGCFQCKRAEASVREFAKLKRHGQEKKSRLFPPTASSSSWASCGWAGLSDSIIDLILQMVVEDKPLLRAP